MDAPSTGGNSAPADTGSTATPTTFAEAFAADASPASGTPETSQTPSAAAQPTTPPEGSPQQTDDRSPFIPRARFDEVNTKKGELESKLQALAWAEQVPQQDFQQLQQIARHFAGGDVVTGLKGFLSELRKDPRVDAELRSLHARELAALRGHQPEQEPQPDLPIQLEDGRVVHLYSAEQQAKREAFLQKQWLQSVEQKLQPLQQTHEQMQQERAELQRQQQVTHFVTTTYDDLKTWPGMDSDANQKAVASALAQAQVDPNDPREVALALNAAYRKVVLPQLSQKAESRLLDTLQKQAVASTGINPGSAAATTPRAVHKFSDLPEEAWR